MAKFWDSDTGLLTITATADGSPVNLTGSSSRTVLVRNRATGTVTSITPASTNLAAGIVTATVTSLGAGTYEAVLRVVDSGGNTYTYPSADVSPPQFQIKADLDD